MYGALTQAHACTSHDALQSACSAGRLSIVPVATCINSLVDVHSKAPAVG